jgi:hypothetical protein
MSKRRFEDKLNEPLPAPPPTFKSNSASGTFHNTGAKILKAVNEQNRERLLRRRVNPTKPAESAEPEIEDD